MIDAVSMIFYDGGMRYAVCMRYYLFVPRVAPHSIFGFPPKQFHGYFSSYFFGFRFSGSDSTFHEDKRE